jgi:phosphate-selective porin OprO/OprP
VRRLHSPTLSIIAAFAVGSALLPAADEVPGIEQRLQALDQEIKILKRKNEIAGEEAATKAAASKDAPKLTASAKDGFSLSSGDGAYKLRIGGFAQIEGRYYLGDDKLPFTNTFTLAKVRPILEGTLAKYFDYRVMFDLAGTPALVDAFVTANADPALRITAGRFKVPFGLENLQSDTNTAFITRGLPTALTPTRDAGFQVGGDVFGGALNYAVGVFNGPFDGGNKDPDTNDDKDAIARLWATPFRDSTSPLLQGLGFGIAGTYGHDTGTYNATGAAVTASNLGGYRTPGNNAFFNYTNSALAAATPANTAVAKGTRTRFSPQLYWAVENADVLAEYVSSTQRIQQGATAADITNTSWQVEAGFVLTGEKASYKGVVPANDLGAGGWGAFQLVARYGVIDIDDAAFSNGFASRTTSASSATDIGIGLNWFLNRNVKIQLNYDLVTFDDGATVANGSDREDEQVIQSRIQFVF